VGARLVSCARTTYAPQHLRDWKTYFINSAEFYPASLIYGCEFILARRWHPALDISRCSTKRGDEARAFGCCGADGREEKFKCQTLRLNFGLFFSCVTGRGLPAALQLLLVARHRAERHPRHRPGDPEHPAGFGAVACRGVRWAHRAREPTVGRHGRTLATGNPELPPGLEPLPTAAPAQAWGRMEPAPLAVPW